MTIYRRMTVNFHTHTHTYERPIFANVMAMSKCKRRYYRFGGYVTGNGNDCGDTAIVMRISIADVFEHKIGRLLRRVPVCVCVCVCWYGYA